MIQDFGKRHWLMMIGMTLLAIAVLFGVGFGLEWAAGKVA
jgi:hypothetical protein